MPGTPLYSIYYELPLAGGGNITRLTHAQATEQFLAMMQHYPDAYIAILNEEGRTIRSYQMTTKD
jgi:hypothetical protein